MNKMGTYICINLIIVWYANALSEIYVELFKSFFNIQGPFNLSMTRITSCNGPKRRDCAVNSAKIMNGTTLIYDMVVREDIKDVRGNMFAISESNQKIKLQMKKLCDHPFWLPFMKKFVNITKNCVILRGNYHMVANAQEMAQKYYGGSFVYGKWTFKSAMFSNDCNFGCSVIDIALTPKYLK